MILIISKFLQNSGHLVDVFFLLFKNDFNKYQCALEFFLSIYYLTY